jgi:hypothetical protein
LKARRRKRAYNWTRLVSSAPHAFIERSDNAASVSNRNRYHFGSRILGQGRKNHQEMRDLNRSG